MSSSKNDILTWYKVNTIPTTSTAHRSQYKVVLIPELSP